MNSTQELSGVELSAFTMRHPGARMPTPGSVSMVPLVVAVPAPMTSQRPAAWLKEKNLGMSKREF